MTQTLTHNKAESASDLSYKPLQRRNISSRALSFLAALFAAIAVLPLILVLGYVLVQGGSKISLALLTQLPPPPGLEDGGIANAIVGTLVVTAIAALIAVPVGVGGGIFLAEYSRSGWFAQFIRFGTNVLAGVPSIIAGVFIYGTIVTSRILLGNAYSAVAGGVALAVLMLPTVIKTTDEGLKLVPDDLRRGALGVGASRFVTVVRITLPAALTPIATGVVLGIARAAGETAPLIFRSVLTVLVGSAHAGRDLRSNRDPLGDDLQLRDHALRISQRAGVGRIVCARGDDPGPEPLLSLAGAICCQINHFLHKTMTTLQQPQATESHNADVALSLQNVTISYGNFEAVKNVYCEIPRGKVTAFIGPSGCGKSTVLRSLNRMNDLIEGCSLKGSILFGGVDLYGPRIDPVEVRRRIGMVFQQPNPFPKSIYENIAFGARINGYTGDMDELIERSLRQAAVWDECKDKLNESGYSLSGGQQQRLCIARTIAIQPEVILMDEPCSALDPISTLKIEETMHELKKSFTIVIVTHNMQQAVRVSDMTAFYNAEAVEGGTGKVGYLVEFNDTDKIFNAPQQQATQDYVSGRFG